VTRATRPLWPLLAALAAGALGVAEWWAERVEGSPSAPTASPAPLRPAAAPCPPAQLLDDGVCIPLPPPETREPESASRLELLPGRPAEHGRYLTPIAGRPATASRSGLGVFVAAPRGTPVMVIALEAQVGPARRLPLAGSPARLLTVHRVERAGAARTYALVYTGIDVQPASEPSDLPVGTPLGRVSDAAAPTGLGIEVRQLRRGVDLGSLAGETVLLDSSSLSCDARNVLPLKPGP
jgi:hypothetical protein